MLELNSREKWLTQMALTFLWANYDDAMEAYENPQDEQQCALGGIFDDKPTESELQELFEKIGESLLPLLGVGVRHWAGGSPEHPTPGAEVYLTVACGLPSEFTASNGWKLRKLNSDCIRITDAEGYEYELSAHRNAIRDIRPKTTLEDWAFDFIGQVRVLYDDLVVQTRKERS